jgi:hypothetical protein
MTGEHVDTHQDSQQKALRINQDSRRFGAFAEIGAGQEVVRWFFQAGGASKTVAKSISAYDMSASDDLYGPTQRYVSRERLKAMLDREYGQIIERSNAKRGDTTAFFVFADTVSTRTAASQNPAQRPEGQAWLGIKFQDEPKALPSEMIVHARLFDTTSTAEQEAIGILGVNLCYGAFCHHGEPQVLISTLLDSLSRRRVEVDMIKLSGPAFGGVDNRLMSLQLIEQGLTDATMFTAQGEVVQPAEVLYQKPVLIERGSFRPVTNVTLGILDHALRQLRADPQTAGQEPVEVFEMTLNNLMSGPEVDHADFLARVDVLGSLDKMVMVSNFTRFDRVSSFLRRQTQNWIAMAVGVPTLQMIFEEKYYSELDGGIREGLGLLFGRLVKLLVYPAEEGTGGAIATAEGLEVAPRLRHLYSYLYENGFIQPIRDFDASQLNALPEDVLALIQSGDPTWEQMVPAQAAAVIRREKLFGCKESLK